jgi:hypothetical protein
MALPATMDPVRLPAATIATAAAATHPLVTPAVVVAASLKLPHMLCLPLCLLIVMPAATVATAAAATQRASKPAMALPATMDPVTLLAATVATAAVAMHPFVTPAMVVAATLPLPQMLWLPLCLLFVVLAAIVVTAVCCNAPLPSCQQGKLLPCCYAVHCGCRHADGWGAYIHPPCRSSRCDSTARSMLRRLACLQVLLLPCQLLSPLGQQLPCMLLRHRCGSGSGSRHAVGLCISRAAAAATSTSAAARQPGVPAAATLSASLAIVAPTRHFAVGEVAAKQWRRPPPCVGTASATQRSVKA